MAKMLSGVTLVTRDGVEVDAGKYLDGKVVGLYFSASWCNPCKAFTPKLKKFYEEIKKRHPEFEVVFVSRDRESNSLVNYYLDQMGAWTYIPFGDPKIQELLTKFEIKTIPAMKIVKPDGKVVINDARTEIQDNMDNMENLYDGWMACYN
ncbi:hypothetical protein WR25_20869 [Diploscapter pachys]|uniref:protein-disulfide reductase n=1 Tax=Diploscapter pachys TaxID=2018661 RepID=A0A2A2JPI3_9BILA|nr:hypothetical protein WR25_20869 [Diploscapter pachys]